MITVAGVTFSITIASVAYASGQFGPRLLGNFMRDRGNQITLGTFIATFVYCLLVLRTVAGADGSTAAFVPHVALLFAMVLAAASLAVFIYFIHHVPESIHISNVIAAIGRDLLETVETLYPVHPSPPEAEVVQRPEGFTERAVGVHSHDSGYVQNFVSGVLLQTAVEYDLVIEVLAHPGDFVHANQVMVRAWPPDRVEEAVEERLRSAYALGSQRTRSQDVMFLVEELVEMAARALSPGINDPFTAINCLDWLRAVISRVARGQVPDTVEYDADGSPRVFLRVVGFDDFAGAAFDKLRSYFVSDVNAGLHMMNSLDLLAQEVRHEPHRRLLRTYAHAVREGCQSRFGQERDVERIERVFGQIMARLEP